MATTASRPNELAKREPCPTCNRTLIWRRERERGQCGVCMHEGEEREICEICDGSGEGQAPDSKCRFCRGKGVR